MIFNKKEPPLTEEVQCRDVQEHPIIVQNLTKITMKFNQFYLSFLKRLFLILDKSILRVFSIIGICDVL